MTRRAELLAATCRADLSVRPVDGAEGAAVRGGQRVVNVRTEVGFGSTTPFNFFTNATFGFAALRSISNVVASFVARGQGQNRFSGFNFQF